MRQRQTAAATESRALKMKFYCGLELLPSFNKMINEILVMKHMKRWMLIHVYAMRAYVEYVGIVKCELILWYRQSST
jgi:hypothetical protein